MLISRARRAVLYWLCVLSLSTMPGALAAATPPEPVSKDKRDNLLAAIKAQDLEWLKENVQHSSMLHKRLMANFHWNCALSMTFAMVRHISWIYLAKQ